MDKSRRLEIFEEVRGKYAGFLTSVLWKLTGERELFAEAMQIALTKIWLNADKLHNNDKAAGYIYRIALSANSRAWRDRTGRNGQVSLEVSQTEPAAKEQDYDSDEIVEILRCAIANLPRKQGRAIVMRYFEQCEYGDIAEKLCCSEAAARSNVSKAVSALRERLDKMVGREF